ncbi:DNA polymerase I [Lacihabitans sp. LS3-19]|uniref:DNA polymerase I n=1 Tax=Lacihabitans sp. LS3-19 TaxID=2487335 RepID=UPI0020CF6D60|nr:DNA polymerase I [Lacihabitans sp. LS3-19]MCP9768470.1 DNA polymerase I [Lacihabitans sp. LS3-19]
MRSKKLFLLDAMALIYRAHFAFIKNPRITSTGLNTSAVFGFTNTMLEVIKKEKPTHLAVCFDTKAPTFRHVDFPEYKANREAQPEDITVAIPLVKRLIKAMCIPMIELDGFEADDVIGTLAKKAPKDEFDVFMYTPDKDYGQLVDEHIFLYKPAFLGNGIEVMGVPEILAKWEISRIDQVIDMLGLMGDKVDNIPGIPGVGEKTAVKLLAEYDSVEGILENADKIPNKIGEKIRAGKESALMSKHLARIDINVPVEFDEEDLKMCEPNTEELSTLLDELEFKTLKNRLIKSDGSNQDINKPETKAKPKAETNQMSLFGATEVEEVHEPKEKDTINTVVHDYYLIEGPEQRAELIEYLMAQDEICFDTETTDVDAVDAEIVGLSFAYRAKEAFYVPCPPRFEEAKAVLEEFRGVFESEKIMKIAQNLKYDMTILSNYGIEIKGTLFDTMLAHYIIEPEQRHGMDYMANNYLNYEPVSIETLIGAKGKKQGNMRDVPLESIKEYAAEDADITLQLKTILDKELKKTEQEKLLYEVEVPLVSVLSTMEREGVKLDVKALSDLSETLNKDLLVTQTEIFEIAGMEFNVGSPKQLGEILFEKMKIDEKPKKTPTGQYATGEDVLSNYEADHEIVKKILDFRELSKLKSTYVEALPLLISKKTGRIHTSYNQAVTATGRLSSTNPNLQNIPIRTERGREIRKAFIPRDSDHLILSADYSQIELRIMAAFSEDASMVEAFNQGIDIHSTTAAKVFGVELTDVSSDMRRKAKMVNFGIIYGISAFGLAQRLGIPRGEAKDIIDAYFVQFPNVKTFMDECVNKARETEYVETILGRRRYLRDINSRNQTNRGFAERNAINAPIQGSAADMIKVAMINIHEFMKAEKLKSKMILQVHDELVFDAHISEIDYLKERVDYFMVNAIPMKVKIETGIGVGKNWLEAH